MASKLRVVPLQRTLRYGSVGRDVTAVQRALGVAGIVLANAGQREFGTGTEAGVRTFQRFHQLAADGVYGPATHAKLAPSFDAYGAWLMGLREQNGVSPEDARRAAIVAAMTLLLNHAAEVHYLQRRPMKSILEKIRPPAYPRALDCSEAATWAYYVAGAPDPNGAGYDGSGYTGTLARHGREVKLADAKPGDLVLYGHAWPYEHVAVVAAPGRVISQGSEPGPFLLAATYRPDLAHVRSYL